jgi:hypothetical protein
MLFYYALKVRLRRFALQNTRGSEKDRAGCEWTGFDMLYLEDSTRGVCDVGFVILFVAK